MTEVAIFFGGVAVGTVIMGWVLIFADGTSAMGVALLIAIVCMVLAGLCLMIERGLKRLFGGKVKPRTIIHDRRWWRGAEFGVSRAAEPEEGDTYVTIEREPPTLPLHRFEDSAITGRPTIDALGSVIPQWHRPES